MFNTTQEQFEQLHRDLDGVRVSSRTVRVDRAALAALLKDHVDYAAIVDKRHAPVVKTTSIEDLV